MKKKGKTLALFPPKTTVPKKNWRKAPTHFKPVYHGKVPGPVNCYPPNPPLARLFGPDPSATLMQRWHVLAPPGQHGPRNRSAIALKRCGGSRMRTEEHTSELQSLMRISYAVFCLKKKKNIECRKSNEYNQILESIRRVRLQRNR